jgi:hypothetical protein
MLGVLAQPLQDPENLDRLRSDGPRDSISRLGARRDGQLVEYQCSGLTSKQRVHAEYSVDWILYILYNMAQALGASRFAS